MIHLMTDSCADLSPELVQQHSIHVLPLYVFVGENSYRDGVDILQKDLFEYVAQTSKLPKTAAPSVGDYIQFFESVEGDIVFTGIGSKYSASYPNACLAAQQLDGRRRFFMIDSVNLSSGITLLLLRADDMRKQGCSAEEISSELQRCVPLVRVTFIVDTLDYLYMGGRCSALQNIVGSLLQIRPVIETKRDGTLGIKEKIRGSRAKTLKYMLDVMHAHATDIDQKRAFITHSNSHDDVDYMKQEMLNIMPFEEIIVTEAGATVSSHCGPGTLGIMYMLKS